MQTFPLRPSSTRRGMASKGRDPLVTLEAVRVWSDKSEAQADAQGLRSKWPGVSSARVFERWVKVDGIEFPVYVVVARGEGSEATD